MSVGSTGSQARLIQSSHPPAHYQPVLMKDLGKTQSPKQDLNVVEIFSGGSSMVCSDSNTSSNNSGGCGGGGGESHNETSTCCGTGDAAEQQYTDHVMDKHLCALEAGSLTSKTSTYDIAKYMANLKHMESEQLDISYECPTTLSNIDTNQEFVTMDYNICINSKEFIDNIIETSDEDKQQKQSADEYYSSESSGSCSIVKVDSKIDKVFNKTKQIKSDQQQMKTSQTQTSMCKSEQLSKHGLRSPSTSNIHLSSHSPDRSRSTGTSPVRIIKIKSPRNSVSDSGSKRLSVSSSRDSSKDRSPDRREVSPRRSSEGGILKRSLSPKPPETYVAPSSSSSYSSSTSSMGILKRSQSPIFKSRSPDRNSCMRKSLSPGNSIDSRASPRGSIDSRSPDRHRLHIQDDCYSSHGGSFESRSSEPNLDIPRSVLKTRSGSHQGSFDSRSPDRNTAQRKRSLSAHSSLEKSKSPEPYYHHYYQFYQEQQQQNSPDPKHRLSKSLERTSSKESAASSSYRYGLSPERIYRIGPPVRSQSAENAYLKQYEVARSNESLTKSIEHPTCVECLYQRKPS